MTIAIYCARCGQDLTDAASRECGVGPVCRNLDNAILATYIPANVSEARDAWAAASKELGNELATTEAGPTAATVYAALFDADAPSVIDWRVTIKRIEFLVSRCGGRCARGARALAPVAAALGYVGLASIWLDQAAKGKALIWAQLGRTSEWNGKRYADEGAYLFVSGPRNAAANAAIKRITDRRFHSGDAHVAHKRDPKSTRDPAAWSVPAKHFDAFLAVVQAHYPNHEFRASSGFADAADWDAFRIEARKVYRMANPRKARGLTDTPAPTPTPVKAAPTCRIEDATDNVLVFTPRNDGFVGELKRLPYRCRKWSPGYGCWIVSTTFRASVEALIAKYYGAHALGA